MAGHGQGERSGKGGSGSEERCPILMSGGKPCSRPIHRAAPDVDPTPVCLMHSRDIWKSDAEFQEEFERILREAGDGLADFSQFIFPRSDYGEFKIFEVNRTFETKCDFSLATFAKDANFFRAEFPRGADFSEATFKQRANFGFATFTQNADFTRATFMQNADFRNVTFTQEAVFDNATFTQDADFGGATFTQDANFWSATFGQVAVFVDATFMQNARFLAVFKQGASFEASTFAGIADFRCASFAGTIQFDQTKFKHDKDKDGEPGPVFSAAVFEEPEKVAFYGVHLEFALFHNCDVSKVNFSDVTWCKRANGKPMVFDEAVNPQHEVARDLRPMKGDPNARNYRLIAELYQQLKKNYDDRRDYWTAGDFHYGEMEMKRLASHHHNKVWRWLHSNLGLVAWYRYASEHGESYVRPTCWLVLVFLVFMLLYPVTGLYLDAGRIGTPATASASVEKLTYWHPLQNSGDAHSLWRARLDLVGHSFVTTLYVAAFQKDLTYQPSYPWGRLLAMAEVLLTSTLGALFLLAVRRQFKR